MVDEVLYVCRVATRALAMVLDHAGLSQMALKFNPDDRTQVVPVPELGEVRFFVDTTLSGHHSIAQVFLSGPLARVVVGRARDIIRRAHRKDFEAAELGLPVRLDVEVDMSNVIDSEGELLRSAPIRTAARRLSRPAPKSISAVAALRRGG